jgi:hypothetical protein
VWRRKLEELKLAVHLMPRNVATRWNSTFDMLELAIEYRIAIDAICVDRACGALRKFEMSDEDWTIAIQLRNTLKVCRFIYFRCVT